VLKIKCKRNCRIATGIFDCEGFDIDIHQNEYATEKATKLKYPSFID